MVNSKILNNGGSLKYYFLNGRESNSPWAQDIANGSYNCQQVHNNKVQMISSKKYYPDTDGLISKNRSSLMIKCADCLPVFIYVPKKRYIAAVHAGWRGLYAGILPKTISKLRGLKADPAEILVSIGPHIGLCCYRVDEGLVMQFKKKFILSGDFFKLKKDGYYLDLFRIAKNQLMASSLLSENIEDVLICTKCNNEFASYRRNKTGGRNYNFLMLS